VAKKKPEPSAEELAAKELVRLAREQGLSRTGPHGLLKQFTKSVLETALNEEMTEHLGHEKRRAPDERDSTNVRNGTRSKTVLTEATGRVQIDVPRDRDGMARATVRWATSSPLRRSSAVSLRRPYSPSGVSRRRPSGRSSSTRRGSHRRPRRRADAGRDRTAGLLPQPVGPCGDLAALLAQHPIDRLDRVTLGPHRVDEGHDHRLRGSSSRRREPTPPSRSLCLPRGDAPWPSAP
jgi:hypothetical protein